MSDRAGATVTVLTGAPGGPGDPRGPSKPLGPCGEKMTSHLLT